MNAQAQSSLSRWHRLVPRRPTESIKQAGLGTPRPPQFQGSLSQNLTRTGPFPSSPGPEPHAGLALLASREQHAAPPYCTPPHRRCISLPQDGNHARPGPGKLLGPLASLAPRCGLVSKAGLCRECPAPKQGQGPRRGGQRTLCVGESQMARRPPGRRAPPTFPSRWPVSHVPTAMGWPTLTSDWESSRNGASHPTRLWHRLSLQEENLKRQNSSQEEEEALLSSSQGKWSR